MKKEANRDITIDFFKGATILWIIHIHVVFWSGNLYLSDAIREYSLLIDVPIFFFLSGYLMFVSSASVVWKRVLRQSIRLYTMYTIFCLMALAVIVLFRFYQGDDLPLFSEKLRDILLIKIDFMGERRGFPWNLWFLRTYFMVLLLALILSIWKESMWRNLLLPFLTFGIYLISKQYLNGNENKFAMYMVFAFFHASFFFLGAAFRSIEKWVKPVFAAVFLLVVIMACITLYSNDNYTLIMQQYKFWPKYQYFIYSLPYLGVFILVKRSAVLEKVRPNYFTQFIEWCSFYIFEIYLVHSFVAHFPFYFVPELVTRFSVLSIYMIVLSYTMVVSLMLVYLYAVTVEKIRAIFARPV